MIYTKDMRSLQDRIIFLVHLSNKNSENILMDMKSQSFLIVYFLFLIAKQAQCKHFNNNYSWLEQYVIPYSLV